MICLRCNKAFDSSFNRCPSCGFEISLTESFNDIKQALQETKVNNSQISDWLNQLEMKIDSLESIVKSHSEKIIQAWPVLDSRDEKTHTKIAPPPTDSFYESKPIESMKHANTYYGDKYENDTKSKNKLSAEVMFGQKWLLIVGIVATVIGIGFFLKYAFDRNWIGPAGRVGLAYLFSVSFLGIGE